MKTYFQTLHNFHNNLFVFAITFSGRRERQISGTVGKWHSRDIKLQIIYSAHDETFRGVDSYTID